MASLFAFASYLGTLIVLGVVCFGLGRFDPKFGAGGSFVVMAVVFAVFLPFAAVGFYLAKRKFAHVAKWVAVAGLVSGLAVPLLVFLLDWLLTGRLVMYLIPIAGIVAAGFASARLTESGHLAATTTPRK